MQIPIKQDSYRLIIALTVILIALAASGCEQVEDPGFEGSSCIGCHTDKELLMAVADAIEANEDTGEG